MKLAIDFRTMKYSYLLILLLTAACTEEADSFYHEEDSGYGDTDTDTDSDTNINTDAGTDSGTEDPCKDIICDDPPDNECTKDDSLIAYTGEAVCLDGECNYSYKVHECEWGNCNIFKDDDDECEPHPCENVICDNPPPGYCVIEDENTDLAYNYPSWRPCELDEDNKAYCDYGNAIPKSTCSHDGTPSDEYCEVIDGIAQCVKK